MQRLNELSAGQRGAVLCMTLVLILTTVAVPVLAAWTYAGTPDSLTVPIGDFARDHGVDPGSSERSAGPETGAVPDRRVSQVERNWTPPSARLRYAPGDVDMLAHLIQAEAGGESYVGQVAVAAVVINRVQSGLFPGSIYGVVFEQDAFESVSNGWYWNPPSDSAYRAAYDALKGWDPSGGALFFFEPSKTWNGFMWSRPQTTQIGNHLFAR